MKVRLLGSGIKSEYANLFLNVLQVSGQRASRELIEYYRWRECFLIF